MDKIISIDDYLKNKCQIKKIEADELREKAKQNIIEKDTLKLMTIYKNIRIKSTLNKNYYTYANKMTKKMAIDIINNGYKLKWKGKAKYQVDYNCRFGCIEYEYVRFRDFDLSEFDKKESHEHISIFWD